jgi:two-component system NtrC family sensor kinase
MKVFKPKSLKGKALLANFIIIFGLIILGIGLYETFVFFNFLFLMQGTTSNFVDSIFEARRFEKNYFLYKNREDLERAFNYVESCEKILKEQEEDFRKFLGILTLQELKNDLKFYKEAISLVKNGECQSTNCIEAVRDAGRILTYHAERLNTLKNKKLKENLDRLKNLVLALLVLLVLFALFYTYYIYSRFNKPLKNLERYILEISRGKFCALPPVSEDREIVLLVEAINTMLAELDKRKDYIVQTEKLATLGTFLFGLTHELNNPLNNIYTTCQVLKEEIKDGNCSHEFVEDLLTEMESEIERIKKVVRSILDYSKPGTKEEFSVKQIVEEILLYLKGIIPHRVKVKVEIPEGITIYADPQHIKQVFINLIKNAIDAIEGEGEIKIKAEETENQAILYVSDTGKGIPANILPKIFEPFFTTKESGKGYGLGLFIVYHLIKSNGGTIEVESEVGKGTTFIIKLPKKGGD